MSCPQRLSLFRLDCRRPSSRRIPVPFLGRGTSSLDHLHAIRSPIQKLVVRPLTDTPASYLLACGQLDLGRRSARSVLTTSEGPSRRKTSCARGNPSHRGWLRVGSQLGSKCASWAAMLSQWIAVPAIGTSLALPSRQMTPATATFPLGRTPFRDGPSPPSLKES